MGGFNQLFRDVNDGTIKGKAIASLTKSNAGTNDHASLIFAGDAVDTETFTMGDRI